MSQSNDIVFTIPNWPAPAGVKAVITTREGGHSATPYAQANLALHVGDDGASVLKNRQQLTRQLNIQRWQWLQQTHSVEVIDANEQTVEQVPEADGVYCRERGLACAVLTADCLPVFLCSQDASEVAILHAGWRGLCGGIIHRGVAKFNASPSKLLAYLGPAIGPDHFEVGEDVVLAFENSLNQPLSEQQYLTCFAPRPNNKYLANIYAMAKLHLHALGVSKVYGGADCTYGNTDHYYSFRREHRTGRFASIIWLDSLE